MPCIRSPQGPSQILQCDGPAPLHPHPIHSIFFVALTYPLHQGLPFHLLSTRPHGTRPHGTTWHNGTPVVHSGLGDEHCYLITNIIECLRGHRFARCQRTCGPVSRASNSKVLLQLLVFGDRAFIICWDSRVNCLETRPQCSGPVYSRTRNPYIVRLHFLLLFLLPGKA